MGVKALEENELKLIWRDVVLALCPDAGEYDIPYKVYFYLCKEVLRIQFRNDMLWRLICSYIEDADKLSELDAEISAAGADIVNQYIIKMNEVINVDSSV